MKRQTQRTSFAPIETYGLLSKHKQLGFNIRTVRRIKSLTQEELAIAVSMPRTTIARIETGCRRVEALELVDIAKALNVKIEELVPL